jgi:hypothetical protein
VSISIPHIGQSKFFIGRISDRLSRDIMAMDRKQCKLVTGLLTGHCTGSASILWACWRNLPNVYPANAQHSFPTCLEPTCWVGLRLVLVVAVQWGLLTR